MDKIQFSSGKTDKIHFLPKWILSILKMFPIVKIKKKLNQHQRVQDRKIFRLCSKQKNSHSVNPDYVVFNFSYRLISDKEKEIVSKGLNFAIPQTKLNFYNLLMTFEKFYNKLKQERVNIHSGFFQ